MNLLRNILPSLRILIVTFRNDQTHSISMVKYRQKLLGIYNIDEQQIEDLTAVRGELTRHPVLVFVQGYGVMNKNRNESSQIVEKVLSDPETFLCNSSAGDNLWFVRKSQYSGLLEQLERISAKVIEIRCDRPTPSNELLEDIEISDLFRQVITTKELIRPTVKGAILGVLLCKRVQLPLLGLIMIGLLINFYIRQSVDANLAYIDSEVISLRQISGKQADISKSAEKLAAQFNTRLGYDFSWICDRIGIIRPEAIILSALSIQPVLKPLEREQHPTISERTIRIEGQGSRDQSVSEFIELLRQEKFTKQLNLIAIEHNIENGSYDFTIDLKI